MLGPQALYAGRPLRLCNSYMFERAAKWIVYAKPSYGVSEFLQLRTP